MKNMEQDTFKPGGQSMKADLSALTALLEEEIQSREQPEAEKERMLEKLRRFRDTRTNIVLVGATGSGKSSTINALFSVGEQAELEDLTEVAKVGVTPDPETSEIEKYTIGNLTLWDTPGLGDSAEQDERTREAIQKLLNRADEVGSSLVDLVLVVMDASSKDLGTTYSVLNDIIIPSMPDNNRILVAMNQADIAMKRGRHWDYENNCPDETLRAYLDKKARSVKERIRADSGVEVEPIWYCAGCKDEGEIAVYPYNMAKLLYYIVSALPAEKRIPILAGLNDDHGSFEYNDDEMDYGSGVEESFFETLGSYIKDGAETGAFAGEGLLGIPGKIVGGIIGGAVGTVGGCIVGLLNFLDRLF